MIFKELDLTKLKISNYHLDKDVVVPIPDTIYYTDYDNDDDSIEFTIVGKYLVVKFFERCEEVKNMVFEEIDEEFSSLFL